MNATERRQHKAADYRAKANAAAEAGKAASLETVRANHGRAEQRWTELADAEDARLKQYATAPGA
ncbi:hypothetical protein [Phenylobacterium sp.]|jgi:hypothetical protein|uniref:hypothetical protein n=1 Tax=Phenylobacterium sp. TaxID=1871053 RepID=UPI002F9404BA